MSTRSNILIKDRIGSVLIYKHHDGWPERMLPFLRKWLKTCCEDASTMANQLILNTECEVSSALHGDIEYYYEVNTQTREIHIYKVDMFTEKHELISVDTEEIEA